MRINSSILKSLIIFGLSFLPLLQANAYLTLGETGEIVDADSYRFSVGPQFRLTEGSGTNIVANLDTQATDDASFRLQLGVGETDFFTGASYKWVPIPDYEDQPAMGLRFGGIYARDGSESYMTVRLDPMISKKIHIDHGTITPYGSVPLMISFFSSKSQFQSQLTVGSEYQNPEMAKWIFGGEVGLNAKDSFSYLYLSATYLLDEVKGRK